MTEAMGGGWRVSSWSKKVVDIFTTVCWKVAAGQCPKEGKMQGKREWEDGGWPLTPVGKLWCFRGERPARRRSGERKGGEEEQQEGGQLPSAWADWAKDSLHAAMAVCRAGQGSHALAGTSLKSGMPSAVSRVL
jgi:hypothetical protein